jgi:hypothetical protein
MICDKQCASRDLNVSYLHTHAKNREQSARPLPAKFAFLFIADWNDKERDREMRGNPRNPASRD